MPHPLRALLAAALALLAATAAFAGPVPPCLSPAAPAPGYAPQGQPPSVAVWTDLTLTLGGSCPRAVNGRARLVVALSGRFAYAGTVDQLAARIGAVSTITGLQYWSASEARWRELISDAYAVTGGKRPARRPDFSAAEVLGGQPLLLVQNDTRSSGDNVYAMTATSQSASRMTVTIVNRDGIGFLFATLFGPGDLVTAQFFERLNDREWGYYSLTVVRDGPVAGKEKSFINRAAAYMRLVTGDKPTRQPPVAP